MGITFRAAAVILAFAAAASCQSAPVADDAPAPNAALIEQGRQYAVIHCAACHAIGTHDASRRREAMAFRSLSRYYPVDELADSLADGIMTGDSDMPEWRLTPDEIAALLAYMQSIQPVRRR